MKLRPTWSEPFASPRGCRSSAEAIKEYNDIYPELKKELDELLAKNPDNAQFYEYILKVKSGEAGLGEGLQEAGQGLVVETDPARDHRPVARSAAGPSGRPVPGREGQRLVFRLGHAVDEGPDETRMKAEVDEAPAGAQAPGHIADDGGEVLHVGVEEQAGRYGHRRIAHREEAGIGSHDGAQPAAGEPELIGGDVEADGAVARVGEDPSKAPGAAGHVQACLSAACAEGFPEEGHFLLVQGYGEGFVVPLGVAVIPSDPGPHGDRLAGPGTGGGARG